MEIRNKTINFIKTYIMKRTEVNKHYWYNEGAYDKEFTELTNKFVPAMGRANDLRGEVIRAVNRLYYEYCNNGNCNAVLIEELDCETVECSICNGEGCEECDYNGYIDVEGGCNYDIEEYYNNFIKIIRDSVRSEECNKICSKIREFLIIGNTLPHDVYFNDEHMHVYDQLIDIVYEWAVNNEGGVIPSWYSN